MRLQQITVLGFTLAPVTGLFPCVFRSDSGTTRSVLHHHNRRERTLIPRSFESWREIEERASLAEVFAQTGGVIAEEQSSERPRIRGTLLLRAPARVRGSDSSRQV